MAASDTDADKRRHQRVNVAKTVRAKSGEDERQGLVRDISAGGAALEIEADWEDGDYAEVDIDDLMSVSGHVTRTFDDGFAIEFDLDEDEEDRLLSEVMEMHNNTSMEEE